MAKPLVKVGIEAPGYRPSRPFKAASPILVHTEEVTVEAVQPGVCAATVPARSAWWAGACPRYAAGRAAFLLCILRVSGMPSLSELGGPSD